jgi:phage terminase small subunit
VDKILQNYYCVRVVALTEKQKKFCHEYLVDLNASAAYKRAGYQGDTNAVKSSASKLLANPNVQSEIRRLQGLVAKKTNITVEKTLNTLAAIAFTPLTEVLEVRNGSVYLMDSEEWSPEAKIAVETVSKGREGIRIKMHSKTDALGKIMQHLGMMNDINLALKTVTAAGFEVKNVSEEAMKNFLEAQGYKVEKVEKSEN